MPPARTRTLVDDLVQLSGLGQYSQTRKVTFHDRRLRALHLASNVMILGVYFFLYQIMFLHEYAAFELPQGTVNTWDGQVATDLQDDGYYCDNPDFSFGDKLSAAEREGNNGYVFTNMTCWNFSAAQHVHTSQDQASVLTQQSLIYRDGSMRQGFVHSPGAATVNMIHAFSVSWFDQGESLPFTELVDKDDNVRFTFEDGNFIGGVAVQDWLDMAGVDLDEINRQQWITSSEEAQPRFRTTGCVLIVTVEMTNLRPFDFAHYGEYRARMTVSRLPDAWGFLGYAHAHDYENDEPVETINVGVHLSFRWAGRIGRFQLYKLTLLLVQSLVLLSSSRTIVSFIALRWFPPKERQAFRAAVVRDVPDLRLEDVHEARVQAMLAARPAHTFRGGVAGPLKAAASWRSSKKVLASDSSRSRGREEDAVVEDV